MLHLDGGGALVSAFTFSGSATSREYRPERGPAVFVNVSGLGLTVCVNNAANQVWRGMGRTFWGATKADQFGKALAAYKSSTVRAILQHAASEMGTA